MSLLHIDDRLAKLADAATRASMPANVIRRPHARRIAVAEVAGVAPAEQHVLELAGSVIEALAAGDREALNETCFPTVHARTPSSETIGLEALVDAMGDENSVFTAIDVTIESLVVVGATVAVEWCLRAVHSRPLRVDWAVIEATGQSIALDGVLIGHLVSHETDGLKQWVFDDIHLYYDTTGLLVQLALT